MMSMFEALIRMNNLFVLIFKQKNYGPWFQDGVGYYTTSLLDMWCESRSQVFVASFYHIFISAEPPLEGACQYMLGSVKTISSRE